MKNFFWKTFFLFSFFIMNLAVFAQGTNDEDGNLEDGDAAEVPINTKLVYLVIIGISFAYYATNKSPKSTLNK